MAAVLPLSTLTPYNHMYLWLLSYPQDTGAGSLIHTMQSSGQYNVTTVPEMKDLAGMAAQV